MRTVALCSFELLCIFYLNLSVYHAHSTQLLCDEHTVEVKVPFCAFNGGSDVFVDAGNKRLGLQSLMSYLEVKPGEVSRPVSRFDYYSVTLSYVTLSLCHSVTLSLCHMSFLISYCIRCCPSSHYLVVPFNSYPQTLHVGDRFTLSGNDTATRDVCSVLWVANHQETGFFIKVSGVCLLIGGS